MEDRDRREEVVTRECSALDICGLQTKTKVEREEDVHVYHYIVSAKQKEERRGDRGEGRRQNK